MPISTIGSNSLNQTSDLTINGQTVGKGGGNVATNTVHGVGALTANSTGGNNTAVGYQAGYTNTTATENTFIGQGAGYTNSVGRRNTFIGRQAGYTSNATTAGQGYNTCIGHSAGYSLTTGYGNTFIGCQDDTQGYGSGHLITTGNKNSILGGYNGNQGSLDIRTLSNRVVLSDGDGNPRLYYDNNGAIQSTSAVGNGTLYPAYFCRAWVFFNCSNAAISGSGNVSSVTRISAGSYRINFTTALPDANYAGVSGFARINATPQFVNFGFDRATTYDRVETFLNGNFDDLSNLSLAYFR